MKFTPPYFNPINDKFRGGSFVIINWSDIFRVKEKRNLDMFDMKEEREGITRLF